MLFGTVGTWLVPSKTDLFIIFHDLDTIRIKNSLSLSVVFSAVYEEEREQGILTVEEFALSHVPCTMVPCRDLLKVFHRRFCFCYLFLKHSILFIKFDYFTECQRNVST
jgi:hypothetical protein